MTEYLKWFEIKVDGMPPNLEENEQLIVSDAQGEIRPAFCIGDNFIGYIVGPVSHWMIISKPKASK